MKSLFLKGATRVYGTIFHHLRLVQFGMSTHVYTLLRIFANALFQSLHVVNPLPAIAFDNADRRKNIHCRQE